MEWEHACDVYAEASGHQLPEDVKCAIVARWAPGSAREFLRMSTVDYSDNYEQLRNALRAFYARG
eukprot:12432116-Heterocapsa_arctica.AAC.1